MRSGLISRIGALVAATLMLAACTGAANQAGSGSTSTVPQILRIGSDDKIDSLNPFVGIQTLTYSTFQITYPYLVMYDPDLKPIPYFATDWSTSSDGKVWTFHTTKGATWSDGQALDAEDVAWTFTTIMKYKDKDAGAFAGMVSHLTKVTTTDANTVVFTYDAPVANVLSQLQQVPILPQQFWGKYAATGQFKSVDMTTPVVSGGPFLVQSYTKDANAVLKANPRYWGPTKPRIAGISLTMFKDDDAMVAALRNHEIDMIESLPPSGVDTLTSAGFAVEQSPSPALNDFIFNSNPAKPKNRELLDPRVREAFASSFDLQQIADTVWQKAAVLGNSIVPPATGDWSDPSLTATPYDPAHANAILDSLGYAKGSDGIRVANGHQMSYEVILPDITNGDRMFAMVQQWLKAIGVEVKPKKVDGSTAWDLTTAPDGKYLNFDLSMWTWGMLPDPDFALSVATCDQWGSWSDTAYCNKDYDKLYALQATQIDRQQRLQTIYQMQQIIARDRPYIFLVYKNHISAHDASWTGFEKTIYGPYNGLSVTSMVNAHKNA